MAARRSRETTRTVPVALEGETPAERWTRRLSLSGFTVVALVLVTVAVVVLAPSLRTLVEQRQQIDALEREIAAKREQVEALGRELDRWSDPAYIEAQARERLMFVYPGEFAYVIANQSEPAEVPRAVEYTAELTTTRVDWVAGLLGAVWTAGLTTQSADELALVGAGEGDAG